MYKISVFNYLGAKGWELIGIQPERTGVMDVWTFKRKIER
jgi:hypothetical protein